MQKNLYKNYPSLKIIKRKSKSLLFDIKALLLHLINNRFVLPRKMAKFDRIHFGCGSDTKKGFLNVDFDSQADIFLDVRNKFNIQSNSIKYIYSSHLVEHLDHDELLAHLKECYRILDKDGVIRIGVPDFEKVFHAYCNHDDTRLNEIRNFLSIRFSMPEDLICRMDWINRAVHEFGFHKTCLDWEKIRNLLIYVGFEEGGIVQTGFREDIDNPSRSDTTFYVEARK